MAAGPRRWRGAWAGPWRCWSARRTRPWTPPPSRPPLAADPGVTDVLLVHLETTSGLLNPLAPDRRRRRRRGTPPAAGRHEQLRRRAPRSARHPLLRRDGVGQQVPGRGAGPGVRDRGNRGTSPRWRATAPAPAWTCTRNGRGSRRTGQWRFTPPTHVLAALDAALDGLDREGGPAARGARYAGGTCAMLADGVRRLGFQPYLPAAAAGAGDPDPARPRAAASASRRCTTRCRRRGSCCIPAS